MFQQMCIRLSAAFAAAVLLLLAVLPAAGENYSYRVCSFEELYSALECAGDGDFIFIEGEITVTQTLSVTADVTISASSPAVLVKGYCPVFQVEKNATLSLAGSLTLQGNSHTDSLILCQPGSELILYSGVTLRDNIVSGPAMGGAVTLYDAAMTMHGGSILNCGCTRTQQPAMEYGAGATGGAVRLRTSSSAATPAKFVMNSGLIDGCFALNGGAIGAENLGSALGVRIEISGGTIQNCISAAATDFDSTSSRGRGSAIFLYTDLSKGSCSVADATAVIRGGTITGCRSDYGVLAYYYNQRRYGGLFLLSGGTISGNSGSAVSGSFCTGICIGEETVTGESCLRLQGSARLLDAIVLLGSGRPEIAEDYSGKAAFYTPTAAEGTVIAGAVTSGGSVGSASDTIAKNLTLLDENANVHTRFDVTAADTCYALGIRAGDAPAETQPDPSEETAPAVTPETVPAPPEASGTIAPSEETTIPTSPTESTAAATAATVSTEATVPSSGQATAGTTASAPPPTEASAEPSIPSESTLPSASAAETAPLEATAPSGSGADSSPLPWLILLALGLLLILLAFLRNIFRK